MSILLQEQHASRLDERPHLQSVEVYTARPTGGIELDCMFASRLRFIHQGRDFLTYQVKDPEGNTESSCSG